MRDSMTGAPLAFRPIPVGGECICEVSYEVLPGVFCIRAGNASPMAFEGTNTWVVHPEGAPACVVVDPGTDRTSHLGVVREFARSRGADIGIVMVTHAHVDHVSGAHELAGACGASLLMRREGGLPDGPLRLLDGLVDAEIVSLPGHSPDSVGIVLTHERAVLSGDLFFSRGWSVIPHPEGDLAQYFASLDLMRAMLESGRVGTVLPGHREVMGARRAIERIDEYAKHRRERLEDVLATARRLGTFDAKAIAADAYSEVKDPMLLKAAYMSVASQVDYLEGKGVRLDEGF